MGALPGYTEPNGDLCPAVARGPQPIDAMLHRSFEFGSYRGQSGQGVDVASGDAPTVAAHDTLQEGEILVVLGDALRSF